MYLFSSQINGKNFIPTPVLFLDEGIDEVSLTYLNDTFDLFGGVIRQFRDLPLNNLMPQLLTAGSLVSYPRGCYYKGVKVGDNKLDKKFFACPIDLDTTDFEVWHKGIKFTLRMNINSTIKYGGYTFALFDIIKADFYGKLLPAIY